MRINVQPMRASSIKSPALAYTENVPDDPSNPSTSPNPSPSAPINNNHNNHNNDNKPHKPGINNINNNGLHSKQPQQQSNISKLSNNELNQLNTSNNEKNYLRSFHVMQHTNDKLVNKLLHGVSTIFSCVKGCFQKCGLCQDDPNQHKAPPPRRYLYVGKCYDKKLSQNVYESRGPRLENDTNENSSFCSNYISTTKYTPLTFIPLNLFEQFNKKANLYFLVIALLSFSDFSPKSPVFSVTPLTFVLMVSAVKEIYEDVKRYEMDKEINNRKVLAYRPGGTAPNSHESNSNSNSNSNNNRRDDNPDEWRFREIAWQDLEVGDLIKVTKKMHTFPADTLLLQSSTNQGLCNIETANLDGETNLKIKQAAGITYSISSGPNGDLYPENKELEFELESEAPNEKMDKSGWKGALKFESNDEPVGVGMTQLILRGCTLRNTDWIIGLVVFTGIDTKLMLNNKNRGFKRSNVDLIVDKALYAIFALQACLCVFGVIAHYIWLENNADNQWYQYIKANGENETDYVEQSLLMYFTFLVLLDLFVPISLYVSMELVKFTQALLINFDDNMVALKYDGSKMHAQARTSNLNEELGQVNFIFSDKTGTLTENKMEFIRCHVGGTRYGPGEMERQHDYVDRVPTPPGMPEFDTMNCQFVDNRLANRVVHKRNEEEAETINEFLTLMSVCHSIIPEYENEDVEIDDPEAKIIYNASSPDEKALVLLAKNLHYYFYAGHVQLLNFNGKEIDAHRSYVNIMGDKHEFNIYNMLEFSSKRKRMSVITRDPRDGKFKLYCKGADNVIYNRLRKDQQGKEWDETLESLKHFAAEGLRTLVCAYKVLSDEEYAEWLDTLLDAKASLENRDVLVEECYSNIEKDLILLGATAIEDKLQEGVPETIANLAVAGISIWVLTGDKVETAINIGRSCRLLTPHMSKEDKTLYVIDPSENMEDEECRAFTKDEFDKAWEHLKNTPDNNPNQGLVISGKALGYVFPHRRHDAKGKEIPPTPEEAEQEAIMQEKVLRICTKCRAVLCCRVSPKQKAQMVLLVRYNVPGTITLAIGDGANDVPMIKAAHVGIGVSGQEGLQAVMASDYAIAQFRFLADLLFIHGAWSYRRTSVLILYSFYKNIMFSMTQIWFACYSGFSGTLYNDPLAGSCFNLIYTALPVLFMAVLDRPYSKEIAKLCPELYAHGPKNESFNLRVFALYALEGMCHSTALFWVPTFFVDSQSLPDGKVVGLWTSSTTLFTCLVSVATAKIMLETKTWTYYNLFMVFISYLLWYVYALVWSALPLTLEWGNDDLYLVAQTAMSLPQYWFCVPMVVTLCMIPEIIFSYIVRMYWPTRFHIIEEVEMSVSKRTQFINEIRNYIASQAQRETDAQQEITTEDKHLGFTDFQVGKDHPDYVISQSQFIKLAMKKPKLIEKMKRIGRKQKK